MPRTVSTGTITGQLVSPRASPPFPVRFLKGQPVFWDDFSQGPGGFIMPERALALQTLNTGSPTLGGPWNLRDGNEYGAYITANARCRSGARSLFVGGDPTTRTYGDVGNQDVSVDVSVPSQIVGVEFSYLFQAGTDPAGHLLSIEDKDPADSTKFRELQLQINPFSAFGQIFVLSSLGTTTIVSNTVKDSNGLVLTGITGPFKGAGASFSRGSTGAWHRSAFVVDMAKGQLLYMYFDKFFVDLRSLGSGLWKNSNPDATVNTLKEGLKRIEFHSVTNGTAFAPPIFHGDVVVTDEGPPS